MGKALSPRPALPKPSRRLLLQSITFVCSANPTRNFSTVNTDAETGSDWTRERIQNIKSEDPHRPRERRNDFLKNSQPGESGSWCSHVAVGLIRTYLLKLKVGLLSMPGIHFSISILEKYMYNKSMYRTFTVRDRRLGNGLRVHQHKDGETNHDSFAADKCNKTSLHPSTWDLL